MMELFIIGLFYFVVFCNSFIYLLNYKRSSNKSVPTHHTLRTVQKPFDFYGEEGEGGEKGPEDVLAPVYFFICDSIPSFCLHILQSVLDISSGKLGPGFFSRKIFLTPP